MNNTLLFRHAVSFLTTFLATFVTVFGLALAAGTPENITGGALASLAIAAVRAAIKAGLETLNVSGDPVQ